MGKAKKLKLSKNAGAVPLADQIEQEDYAQPSGRVKKAKIRQGDQDEEYVQNKLTKNILTQARIQAAEEESGESLRLKKVKKVQVSIDEARQMNSDSEESESDDETDLEGIEFEKSLRLNPKEEETFDTFMNKDAEPRRNLADIIMEKIKEKRTEIETQFSDTGVVEFDPRVVEMYKEVGSVLKRYRSGKVPKAFKVIAQFRNWEDLVLLTEPDKWSAAAMYQATRIFAANLKERMTQRFYNCILLPRIRDDIDTYQKLNFHLYQAMRKSLFKPGAFFKGFLLPLCESGTCTLREAIIIGSVLAKNSIPVLHSCAALLKIAEMEYSGANSIFLRIFFDKKYALPYRVIDAVVFHFLNFRNEKKELPVLWHQAFLTFIQRYKSDISSEQKEALQEILKIHFHHSITPEIRRELQYSKCRDTEEPMEEEV